MVAGKISETAKRIHKEAIIIDGLQWLMPKQYVEKYREYFRALLDGGVTAIHWSLFGTEEELDDAIKTLAKFYKDLEKIEEAKLILTAADVESAKEEGKVGIIIGTQEARFYERDLDLVEVFYKLGLRVAQLSYDRQNYLSSGCAETVDAGLTDLGREAVKEFNRLGILIDVSHSSDKTTIEAAEASKVPIVLTHSGSRTLVEMPRATSDEAINVVAQKGGLIGQIFERPFAERKDRRGKWPTFSDVIDQVDYLVGLVGVDHVAIASDFMPFMDWKDFEPWVRRHGHILLPHTIYYNMEEMYPKGLDWMRGTINITEELVRHGYSDDNAKKILGGNWLRLLREVIS